MRDPERETCDIQDAKTRAGSRTCKRVGQKKLKVGRAQRGQREELCMTARARVRVSHPLYIRLIYRSYRGCSAERAHEVGLADCMTIEAGVTLGQDGT